MYIPRVTESNMDEVHEYTGLVSVGASGVFSPEKGRKVNEFVSSYEVPQPSHVGDGTLLKVDGLIPLEVVSHVTRLVGSVEGKEKELRWMCVDGCRENITGWGGKEVMDSEEGVGYTILWNEDAEVVVFRQSC